MHYYDETVLHKKSKHLNTSNLIITVQNLCLGYRLVMKGQELISASRLHVDYAQARDDQYEWEMKKRHLMREERRQQQTRSNPPPSPPLIPHFTEAKALSVSEEIKGN